MSLKLPLQLQFPTRHLLNTTDFDDLRPDPVSGLERSHRRANSFALAYKPTIDDVLTCSEKFWNMHLDPLNPFDGPAAAFWTLQLNLAGGTLAPFIKDRPDLATLWEALISYKITVPFMLTEVGHGLDAPNIETTARILPDGGFDFHTPNDNAAKFMPASVPAGGIRIAVVMARLNVQEKDFGVRAFLVPLNDGKTMCSGITSKPLPDRCGSKDLGHAITHFNHVKLPPQALLGGLEPPKNMRLQFLSVISRIGVGSTTVTAIIIPALKIAAYITARYSQRRTITTPNGQAMPLISFRTQQTPILHALVNAIILEAFYKSLRPYFTDKSDVPLEIRNGLATVFKAVAVNVWRICSLSLSDRCGAQGLFAHNQIVAIQMEIRGLSIAEGDILVIGIRLASELLLGRYKLPDSRHPHCLLAQHEVGVFKVLQAILLDLDGTHRSEEFNRRILPQSLRLVEAIGSRMAYEAALDAGVDKLVLDLFESAYILRDIAWYTEHGLLNQSQAIRAEELALSALVPHLEQLLEQSGAEPYAFAPIVSAERWMDFVRNLPTLEGNAHVNLLDPLNSKTTARL